MNNLRFATVSAGSNAKNKNTPVKRKHNQDKFCSLHGINICCHFKMPGKQRILCCHGPVSHCKCHANQPRGEKKPSLCAVPKQLFSAGQSPDEGSLERIQAEATVFQDLAVFQFRDTYRNLTVKTLSSLQFFNVAYNGSYLYKIDDDVFPKLKKILSFISSFKLSSPNVMFGAVLRKAQVQRNGKWALSVEEYPPKFYPDYCNGPLYGLTTGAVKALLAANKNIPLIPIEDAALGILAQKSGNIKLVHIPQWHNINPKKKDLETCSKHFSTHNVPTANILKLWNSCGEIKS